MSQENHLRAKALKWWRDELSINEQNKLIQHYFPNWDKEAVAASSSKIQEIYEKETE